MSTQANLQLARQTQLLADGIARYVAFAISAPAGPNFLSGELLSCSAGALTIKVRVTDAQGLLDLNSSPRQDILALLKGVGLDERLANSVANSVIDFRDGDMQALEGGSELDTYMTASRGFGPKNMPFESTVELDQLPGMTSDLLSRLDPYVTVYGRSPTVDTTKAPRQLTSMLRDVHGRRLAEERPAIVVQSRLQDLRVEVFREGNSVATRHAVVEMRPERSRRILFREWRSPSSSFRGTDGSPDGACAAILAVFR